MTTRHDMSGKWNVTKLHTNLEIEAILHEKEIKFTRISPTEISVSAVDFPTLMQLEETARYYQYTKIFHDR